MLKKNRKTIIIVLIALCILGGVVFIHSNKNESSPLDSTPEKNETWTAEADNSNDATNEQNKGDNGEKQPSQTKKGEERANEDESSHNYSDQINKQKDLEEDDDELPMDINQDISLSNDSSSVVTKDESNDDEISSPDYNSSSDSFELPIVP